MIPTSVRIFVCTERQDMRRSFDAHALAVKERMGLDPQSGALFVFAKSASTILEQIVLVLVLGLVLGLLLVLGLMHPT